MVSGRIWTSRQFASDGFCRRMDDSAAVSARTELASSIREPFIINGLRDGLLAFYMTGFFNDSRVGLDTSIGLSGERGAVAPSVADRPPKWTRR
ncbi:hypothetical protein EVAR_32488_1 [Eumeta japonica]|uniref:Uncharacterized protein n=1 Tax=Eumeta variegata TaxID=151549 RepID=A0A4C1W8W6_EUMVA|nr:hypothetical protein EVAR_32488_1 [Eumeta japonica]